MQTISGDLYDYPKYYDLVFGSDWKAELDFLTAAFEKFSRRRVRRVFEPACGTGRLLYRLARAGYDAAGIDLNRAAVDYCNRRLERHGAAAAVQVADMTQFVLSPPADAAFNMINSFRHLQTERLARDHLRAVCRSLKPGGIYLLGLHLTPTLGPVSEEESWSARRGHLGVTSHLKTIERDLQRRRERFRMTFDVYTPSRSFRLAQDITFRTYTAGQFRRLLAGAGGFEIAAAYDFTYQIEEPIDVERDTEDVVFVLRKLPR